MVHGERPFVYYNHGCARPLLAPFILLQFRILRRRGNPSSLSSSTSRGLTNVSGGHVHFEALRVQVRTHGNGVPQRTLLVPSPRRDVRIGGMPVSSQLRQRRISRGIQESAGRVGGRSKSSSRSVVSPQRTRTDTRSVVVVIVVVAALAGPSH